MIYKPKYSNIILFIITIIFSINVIFNESLGKWFLLYGIILNLNIILQVKRSQVLVLIMFFALSYLLYLIPVYFMGQQIGYVKQYHNFGLFNKVLFIHIFFLSSFLLFLKSYNYGRYKLSDSISQKNNPIIFYCLIVLMLITIIGVKGSNIFAGGDSYNNYATNLSQVSGSWEYFYICFIVAFVFANTKFKKNILLTIGIFYITKSLLLGTRIQLIQMFFICFVLFFDNKLKLKYLLIFMLLGVISMEVYGVLKEVGISDLKTIMTYYDNVNTDRVLLTNQTEVFYSSSVYVGVIQDGILTPEKRIISALGLIENSIVPSKYVIKEARLPSYIQQYAHLGGGGLISVQFYVWFGYLGVFIIAFVLAYFFNKLYSSNMFALLGTLVIGVFPRWFAYDPANFLLRLPIYLFVFYMILSTLDKYLKMKKRDIE
jgi:hypothetical protein